MRFFSTLAVFVFLGSFFLEGKAPLAGWSRTNSSIPPAHFKNEKDISVITRVKDREMIVFQTSSRVPATVGQTYNFTLEAEGEGVITAGFYGYSHGFTCTAQGDVKITLAPGKKSYKGSIKISSGRVVSFLRPRIKIPKGEGIIKIHSFSCTIEGKAMKAAPKSTFKVTFAKPSILKAGEKSNVKILFTKDGKKLTQGRLNVTFLKDDVFSHRKTYDLAKGNPVVIEETLATPGFLVAKASLASKEGAIKDNSQLFGVGFAAEKIRMAGKVPSDLITYWNGEYAKMKKAVPGKIVKVKKKSDAAFDYYTLTGKNLGGTPIYATLTIPKGKGPFPMVFSVPPAGRTVWANYKTPKAIHLTTAVFDRDFPDQPSYNSFNKPTWYFLKGATKKETYYYYKSILGVMRMMEYAMKEVKEWDGKNLVAEGRSQGGGFAFIMTALNPKIKAVIADVPALCDHNARVLKRAPGWPRLLDRVKGFRNEANYFDAASFAAYVKVPAYVTVGLLDTMCTPSSILSAYNNLKGPKDLLVLPLYGHGWGYRAKNAYNDVKNIMYKKYLYK